MKFLVLQHRLAASLLTVCALRATSAQEPRRLAEAESIPFELATALISSGGVGGDPQVLVGAAPGWMMEHFVAPPNGRILGSAFMGVTGVVIVRTPDMPDVAIASMRRDLDGRGWKSAPPPLSYGGGFRPAVARPRPDPIRLTLCQGQQVLFASASRRRGVATDVVVRMTRFAPNQGGPCNPPALPAGYRSPWPLLFNPEDAVDATQACSANGALGASGPTAIVRTSMSAAALLDHYATQLTDSGWHARSQEPTVVGRTWTTTDSTGSPTDLTLTVTTSPRDTSCRVIGMTVIPFKRP
jgi:hypothetical protein